MNALIRVLVVFAILSAVPCYALVSDVPIQRDPSKSSTEAISKAALQSYATAARDTGIDHIETFSPPLQGPVKRLAFPDLQLDHDPPSLAIQPELVPAQRVLPNVLQVTASGLAGVAEAGKTLFDGIVQVLQQSQVAWANLENAANLTRLVQDSLSSSFGGQLLSSPFSLSINSTMQPSGPNEASRARVGASKDTFWFELIEHNGNATYNPDPKSYRVFRNVKDFGAKGE